MKIGTRCKENGLCDFVLWAPFAQAVEVKVVSQRDRIASMVKDMRGYWKTTVDNIFSGDLYLYRLDNGTERPDPASHSQPQGVHGPSQVIDHNSFSWHDHHWRGIEISEMIIYELHTGTFTPEGTFDAVIPRLDDLGEVGINAIEIMPVSQFPGDRNWGYDGVYPFAVQNSYGGPDGLKRLVNECHKKNISVILDVVYNHIGPEGNYLRDFGPYFTGKYHTPWGEAINFDGEYSPGVRNFFFENALYWFKQYHIDGLRIDAIHGIYDMSARPFLRELAETVAIFSQRQGRKYCLIAESDLNNAYVVRTREAGGYGLDAQWCDDFHHAIHTLITGESSGYYIDFGKTEDLITSLKEGFVYSGRYSRFRKRNHGNSSSDIPADRFVVFSQNHDQTGNRMKGERLSSLASLESLKLAAGTVLLSPYVPLLFMGEEYGETAPFLYFVSHSDEDLVEAVRKGRKEEFSTFRWAGNPPDPQSNETFLKSRITWERRNNREGRVLLNFYKTLIRMRRKITAFSHPSKGRLDVWGDNEKKIIVIKRWKDESLALVLLNFNSDDMRYDMSHADSGWKKILDSSDTKWDGPGTLLPDRVTMGDIVTIPQRSFAVYQKKIP
jgi:maltooligosyltrehalose trehalohydrolase